jgi:hypothetical protein
MCFQKRNGVPSAVSYSWLGTVAHLASLEETDEAMRIRRSKALHPAVSVAGNDGH